MQKPLKDISKHFKNIILSDIPDTYAIKPMFKSISDDESIRNGVIAFRNFLYRLFDYLIINGDLYDKPKKTAHAFSDRVSLSTNYPFLKNINDVLISIGINGNLSKNGNLLTVDGEQFRTHLAKTPAVKVIECLHCLIENGFCISGIDLTEKKVNLSGIEMIEVSYPDDPDVLIGLKVMAKAKEEYEGTDLYGIFLRCDYRVITDEEIELICFLRDMVKPLPLENQEFILRLHQKYLDDGFQCKLSIVDDTCIRFYYLYKRKEIWSFIISPNNGYELAIRAKNTHQYADIVEQLHPYLQEKISKGYGCDKKRDPKSYCQGGCKGFRISMTDSISDMSKDIITWINKEFSYLQKK